MEAVEKKVEEKKILTRQEMFAQLNERIKEIKAEPPIEHDPNNVLEVHNLVKYFPIKTGLFSRVTGYVRAVDGVDSDRFRDRDRVVHGGIGRHSCNYGQSPRGLFLHSAAVFFLFHTIQAPS